MKEAYLNFGHYFTLGARSHNLITKEMMVTSHNSKLIEALIQDISSEANKDSCCTDVMVEDCSNPKSMIVRLLDNNTVRIDCFDGERECDANANTYSLPHDYTDALDEIKSYIKTDKVLFKNSVGEEFKESDKDRDVYYWDTVDGELRTIMLSKIDEGHHKADCRFTEIFKSKKSLFQYLADQEK